MQTPHYGWEVESNSTFLENTVGVRLNSAFLQSSSGLRRGRVQADSTEVEFVWTPHFSGQADCAFFKSRVGTWCELHIFWKHSGEFQQTPHFVKTGGKLNETPHFWRTPWGVRLNSTFFKNRIGVQADSTEGEFVWTPHFSKTQQSPSRLHIFRNHSEELV